MNEKLSYLEKTFDGRMVFITGLIHFKMARYFRYQNDYRVV